MKGAPKEQDLQPRGPAKKRQQLGRMSTDKGEALGCGELVGMEQASRRISDAVGLQSPA